MPFLEEREGDTRTALEPLTRLPFPPLTKRHVRHCGFDWWFPRLRPHTPKARLIPLTTPFIDYLRADGIVLPSNDPPNPHRDTNDADDSGFSSASDTDSEDDNDDDPSTSWPEIHSRVRSTIAELDGKVTPKLNWSAPKDATWISATNDMECRTPDDVYMLLKSSDFITHDLEHAFDDCVDDDAPEDPDNPFSPGDAQRPSPFIFHLVLRKSFNLNPSLEFRCFVRDRILLAICQRDLNHFDFLFPMRDSLSSVIKSFLATHLLPKFGSEDPNFVFDVYVPPPHDRVWLIDINPWAIRTDPILFSWRELLEMPARVPGEIERQTESADTYAEGEEEEENERAEEVANEPVFRLVRRDDPEAYQFNSARYSAHKLPKDVVDASRSPGGVDARELLDQWKRVMEGQNAEDEEQDDDENDDGEETSGGT
ncbi:MAG: hypothetical protein Q9160_007648 [Pyrenula sp. 1 TL-2023]